MAAAAALAVQPTAWHLAARLASVIARPIDHGVTVPEEASAVEPGSLQALSRHPAFHEPVNRAQSRLLELGRLEVTREFLERLAGDPRARLCALLVAQPLTQVGEAALAVSAAILHRQAIQIVLKADRERLRAVFGESGFEIATREALLFHGPLADLASGFALSSAIHPDVEPVEGRRRAVEHGLAVLAGFVDANSVALGDLFRLRVRTTGRDGGPAVSDQHGDHIVRLLRRRVRTWSALIG